MIIHNGTELRGFLAHLQSNVRKLATLEFEKSQHPDYKPGASTSYIRDSMREEWGKLERDVVKVLGFEAALKPFNQLAGPGSFSVRDEFTRDPFRITMKELKKRADKARRKDPSITLMRSWDLETHQPPEEE